MAWHVVLLLSVAPLAIIGGSFLVLHVIVMLTGRHGYASGVQRRGTECDRTREASEAGMVRVGGRSMAKRTFGFCGHCQGYRWIAIEGVEQAESARVWQRQERP